MSKTRYKKLSENESACCGCGLFSWARKKLSKPRTIQEKQADRKADLVISIARQEADQPIPKNGNITLRVPRESDFQPVCDQYGLSLRNGRRA